MNPITKTIEAGGVSYTFRLPSSEEMIQLDLNALQLRAGVTTGLSLAIPHSENISALNMLCTSPEKVEFGKLPFYVVNKLGGGLWKWLNSFSEPDDETLGESQKQSG